MVGVAARLFLLLGCASLATAAVEAGAAKYVITPDPSKHFPAYMAGFGNNRVATGIHDDLYARCLAIRAGGKPLVMCGVDIIGLFWEDVVRIRKRARDLAGRDIDVVIGSLHDHEAPDTMGLWGPKAGVSGINEIYNSFVIEQAAQAAADAVHSMRPAVLTLAKTHPAELDTFIDDDRPPEVHDAEIIALSAKTKDGKPIGTLINWANHPETLGSKNKLITADYSAGIYKRLEERLGGIAVFINGAVGGMQSTLGAKVKDPATGALFAENTFEKAEFIGHRVAELAADAVRDAKPAHITVCLFRETIVHIPVTNRGFNEAAAANLYGGRKPMTADSTTAAPVGFIRMSDKRKPLLEIALIPGELYPELSVGGIERYPGADFPDAPAEPAIKNNMRAPFRMLFGLADDEIGYIIPKAEWDNVAPWLKNAPRRWYGEVNSTGPDAAPIIAAAVAELAAR